MYPYKDVYMNVHGTFISLPKTWNIPNVQQQVNRYIVTNLFRETLVGTQRDEVLISAVYVDDTQKCYMLSKTGQTQKSRTTWFHLHNTLKKLIYNDCNFPRIGLQGWDWLEEGTVELSGEIEVLYLDCSSGYTGVYICEI